MNLGLSHGVLVPHCHWRGRAVAYGVLDCPRCGGRMRLSATIEDPQAIRKILAHLGLPSEVLTSPHPGPLRHARQADPSPPQASAPSVVRFRLDSLLTRGLSCPVAGRIRTLFIRPVSSGAVGVASVPGVWTDTGHYAAYARLPALSAVTPAPLEGAAGVALLENRDPARVDRGAPIEVAPDRGENHSKSP